jgi:hypothetical protein
MGVTRNNIKGLVVRAAWKLLLRRYKLMISILVENSILVKC